MKKDIANMEKMLERLRFTDPVNPAVKKHIQRIKVSEFSKIVETAGGGSFFFSLTARFFFFMQTAGFSTTMAKSALILATAGIILLSGISAGIYFGMTRSDSPSYTTTVPEDRIKKISPVRDTESTHNENPATTGREEMAIPHEKSARLYPLTGRGISEDMLNTITVSLYNELNRLGGRGTAWLTKIETASPWIIVGEVDDLNGTLTISLRLVTATTGKIEAYGQEKVSHPEDIDRACRRLGDSLLERLRSLREAKP